MHGTGFLTGSGGGQTPVLHGTRLYVRDNVLGNVILDTATGYAVGTFSATPPPAFDGTLGFFLSAGSLQARDVNAGIGLWTFSGDGKLITAPVVVNGRVYEGSSSGTLYALDEGTGAQLWTGNLGAAMTDPNFNYGSGPITGMSDGEGTLLVPASNVLVAYGAPRQELWMARNLPTLGVPVALGVGGVLDYVAGRVPRAPRWMQTLGIEWLYRLVRQPWRWRRQLALPCFALLALWETPRRRAALDSARAPIAER